ncbi:protoporphyrinogen oxidase [Aeribacillus sp. FSL K6-1121]|uniref:protoporphyrinogen oxidase n=1 Tax=Aeribacillus sp. FSL K6-1121 TaxID=2954745 RepID=UPI0030FD111C
MGRKKVAIVGGGITGLSVAFYLQSEIKKNHLPIDVVLIEAKPRLGGKIETIKRDGFIIERGPDSFLERKKSATQLAKDVGLGDYLVNNDVGQSFVLVGDKLHPIPKGAVMGVPTNIASFATSGLFSLTGKLRASFDLFLPKKKVDGDQSLGGFFGRRLGSEVVENLIEPLLSGIYAGDIYNLSLLAIFPHFYEIEQKHRSLILGMAKQAQKSKQKQQQEQHKGIFQTVSTGLQSIVEAIERQLDHTVVKKGIKVSEIKKEDDLYHLELSDGTVDKADAIVITAQHDAIPSMFPNEQQTLAYFKKMPSTSVATVAMAYPEEAVQLPADGTGFVVSRNSGYTITACTWTNKKWPHTAPKGKTLLRAYVGKAGDEAVVDEPDDVIIQTVLDDLNRLMPVKGEPIFSIVTRLREAMPQYIVGHLDNIRNIKSIMGQKYPGIYLTGASFEGLGIPDCIDQGKKAVKDVLQFLHLGQA